MLKLYIFSRWIMYALLTSVVYSIVFMESLYPILHKQFNISENIMLIIFSVGILISLLFLYQTLKKQSFEHIDSNKLSSKFSLAVITIYLGHFGVILLLILPPLLAGSINGIMFIPLIFLIILLYVSGSSKASKEISLQLVKDKDKKLGEQ